MKTIKLIKGLIAAIAISASFHAFSDSKFTEQREIYRLFNGPSSYINIERFCRQGILGDRPSIFGYERLTEFANGEQIGSYDLAYHIDSCPVIDSPPSKLPEALSINIEFELGYNLQVDCFPDGDISASRLTNGTLSGKTDYGTGETGKNTERTLYYSTGSASKCTGTLLLPPDIYNPYPDLWHDGYVIMQEREVNSSRK